MGWRFWTPGAGRDLIDHHGQHGKQSTRGILVKGAEQHPHLARHSRMATSGVRRTSTRVRLPLPGDSRPLVLGQVVDGMHPYDPPAQGKPNDPMLPIGVDQVVHRQGPRNPRAFSPPPWAHPRICSTKACAAWLFPDVKKYLD